MDNDNYVPTPWNWNQKLPTHNSGETLKQHLPTYLNSIREHYGSSPTPSSRLAELSSFDLHRKWTSGVRQDRRWGPVIMAVAPSVVSVSIFTGVQRKIDCTGLIISWDDSAGMATVITSAKLARLPQVDERDDYYIVVRLSDGKILSAEEHYVDYYHNIMTLKVISDTELRVAELCPSHPEELNGIEAVALRRDFVTCSLSESNGIIHNDFPYFGCEQLMTSTCVGSQAGEGGPLVTRMGDICGINFFDGNKNFHPLPTTVVRSCLNNWNSHGKVVQPWFGFSVTDFAQLPYNTMETIAGRAGLCCRYLRAGTVGIAIIKQVHEGSPAHEAGVCAGDSIAYLDGSSISSTSEYSRALSTVSDNLSALETLDSARNIEIIIHGGDHHNRVVCAKNLTVDDKRLSCCWPGDEDDWYRDPLFGSQKDPPYDMGINNNLPPPWLRDYYASSS